MFKEVLEDVLPEHIATAVKAETETLAKDVADVKNQMVEIAKTAKFGGEDSKKELYSKTAKYFKALARKDEAAFAEAKAAFLNE